MSQVTAVPEVAAVDGRGAEVSLHVTAPTSGTVFRHRDPLSPPYVEVGSRVARGEPLCVIVAMKMIRRVEAEFDCVVEEVRVGSGQPVERGAPLFRVRRCRE